jgi:hypothetical protein
MPSGLGHSPVERRPPAVFLLCSSWTSHKDLIYIIFAFKPRRKKKKKKKKKKPVSPM